MQSENVPVDCWETAKELLITQFGPRHPRRFAYRDLFFIRQGATGTLRSYIGRFRALAEDAGSEDNNFVVAAFIHGLPTNFQTIIQADAAFAACTPDYSPLEMIISRSFDLAPTVCRITTSS